ncbi:hypothetical protein Q4577_20745 [Marinovum sp. 2_MG-2023]|uniref:hypothetical protein n=1 Tax=unclassified Marinovum TaxID=2647166 RepID=UPI0026E2A005|nr:MULTISPECIES: hypothetical protein [unclassified Marinovum]MDO6732462.1 hypothetical protein [Marinovum sp. 2_MG-2023]MDO6781779.1 hypothetical protein [Marinovum sp. 1_MG-2023]
MFWSASQDARFFDPASAEVAVLCMLAEEHYGLVIENGKLVDEREDAEFALQARDVA